MSLSNMVIFNKYAYATVSELVSQQINLFNAATRGAIILKQASDNNGDFSEQTFWQLMNGAIRRRDPYATGAVAPIDINMLVDAMVKVGSGTPPINIPPSMFSWINIDPKAGGVLIGQQLAPLMVQDMLNTAVAGLAAALSNQPSNFLDVTGEAVPADTLFSPSATVKAKAKLGDRSGAIAAWVVHSKPMHDYWAGAVNNANQLFTYGTVAVVSDPFGNPLIMSDVPSLVSGGDYVSLGLVPGAAMVERNNDFEQNIDTRNGDENILRTYQAEWSYNLGLKGFTWDKVNGGKAPSSAGIATGTNWDKTVTSSKDLAGVALLTL